MTHVRRPNRRRIPELAQLVNGGNCPSSGKVRWLSERGAEIACAIIALHDDDIDRAALLQVYRCTDGRCGDWHVGHRHVSRERSAS